MRSTFVLALLATAAPSLAQTGEAGRPGLRPFAALGSAAPEQVLFRSDAQPVAVAGLTLGQGFDLEAGLGAKSRTRAFAPPDVTAAQPGPRLGPEGASTVDTRALTLAAGYRQASGPIEARTRVSLAASRSTVTLRTDRIYASDGVTEVDQTEQSSADLGHLGASVGLAVPIRRGNARLAPGVALAVATDRRLDEASAPGATSWGAFLSVPTTVAIGSVAVTLDAAVGAVHDDQRFDRTPWKLTLDGAVRVAF